MFNISPIQKPQDHSNHLFATETEKVPQGLIGNYIFKNSPSPLFFRNPMYPGNHGFLPSNSTRKGSVELEFKSPMMRPSNFDAHHTDEKHDFIIPKTPIENHRPNPFEKPLQRNMNNSHDSFTLEMGNSETKEKLSSFFLDVLPKIFDKHWEPTLTKKNKLSEFSEIFDVKKNIDNLIYLEIHDDEKKLQEIFTNHYQSLVKKLQTQRDQVSTNEALIKHLFEFSCKMLHEIHSIIQTCNSEFCLEILKKKTLPNKKLKTEEKLDPFKTIIMPKLNDPNFTKNPEQRETIQSLNRETLEALSSALDNKLRRKHSSSKIIPENLNVSLIQDESFAKPKKSWSDEEIKKLENLVASYQPNAIPTLVLEDFSKALGRTFNSVQSKLTKMKKKGEETDQVSSNLSKVPIKKMIVQALKQLHPNSATKEQILLKIREIFYMNSFNINEETFQNSVSTLLSSQNCFMIIKGTYKLKSPDKVVNDLKEATTMKLKLRYILTQFSEHKATLTEIKLQYEKIFFDSIKDDKEKTWATNLTKILNQSEEFDVTDSKTKYCLTDKLSSDD